MFSNFVIYNIIHPIFFFAKKYEMHKYIQAVHVFVTRYSSGVFLIQPCVQV